MATITISITDLRKKFESIIDQVDAKKDVFIVTMYGKPKLTITPIGKSI